MGSGMRSGRGPARGRFWTGDDAVAGFGRFMDGLLAVRIASCGARRASPIRRVTAARAPRFLTMPVCALSR